MKLCKNSVPQPKMCSVCWTSSPSMPWVFMALHSRPEVCLAGGEERTGDRQQAQTDPSLRRQEKIRVCLCSQAPLNNSRFLSPPCELMKQVEHFQQPAELCISSHVESAVWRLLFCFHLFQSPGLSHGGGFFQLVPVWQGKRNSGGDSVSY